MGDEGNYAGYDQEAYEKRKDAKDPGWRARAMKEDLEFRARLGPKPFRIGEANSADLLLLGFVFFMIFLTLTA